MDCNDALLDRAGAARRGFIEFRGGWYNLPELLGEAEALQKTAMEAKLGGDHAKAVQLYRQLLPYAQLLDELNVFGMPTGMQTQLVQRAIELEEAGGAPPVYSPPE